MRITGIEVFELHRPFDGTAWNAGWVWRERRVPLLRLTAADGTAGLGEVWTGASGFEALMGPLRRRAEWLLGRDLDDVAMDAPEDWAGAAVASGFDIACWDLRARLAGLPLFRMLGGAGDAVPVYASGGLYGAGKGPDALAAEMAGYAALGFGTVKMKIGGLTLAEDLVRVAAVRRALGPDATIIVDAVGQLTRASAPEWMAGLAGLGVRHVQAPLPDAELEGMAALRVGGTLVIGQEREHRAAGFEALLRRRAVALLQFCPGLAGGMTGGLALMAQAEAAGVPVTLQCFSTAVMQAACFHLGAGRAGVHSVEYHRFHDTLYEALPPEMTRVRAGMLRLGDQPGLGLDPAMLDRPPPGPVRLTRLFRLQH